MEVIQIEDGIKIPLSKVKMMFAWLGCLAFVGLGFWLIFRADAISEDENIWTILVGCLNVVFFGIGVILFPSVLFSNRSGLYITSEGIGTFMPYSKDFVAWNEIEGFGMKKYRSTRLLLVMLKNPEDYLNRQNAVKRWMGKMSINTSGTPYSITSNNLNCTFDELQAVLQSNFEKFK